MTKKKKTVTHHNKLLDVSKIEVKKKQKGIEGSKMKAYYYTGSFNLSNEKLGQIAEENHQSAVNSPSHYGGANNPYETIKVVDAWNLNYCLGNAVKYISRAGKKDPSKLIEDLEKAQWYLTHQINKLKQEKVK